MQSLELGAQSPTDEDVEAPASDSAAVDSQLPGDGVYHFILNPSSGSESLSEEELRSMLDGGDRLVLSKFSGVLQVTAAAQTQEAISAYLILVNHRITVEVREERQAIGIILMERIT